jgi:hypothetical protein
MVTNGRYEVVIMDGVMAHYNTGLYHGVSLENCEIAKKPSGKTVL